MGFDFAGTYTLVDAPNRIVATFGDRQMAVSFVETADGVAVTEEFDAEEENDYDMQRAGWQAILDSFKRHVEGLS